MKIDATEYSILCAIVSLVLSILILLFMKKEEAKLNKKAILAIIGSGFFSKIPNYLLLISLVHLPASAQYPFITGGVMIVSTLICFFGKNKPSKKRLHFQCFHPFI